MTEDAIEVHRKSNRARSGVLVAVLVGVLVVAAVVASVWVARGWSNGYGAGYEAGWQAAWVHIASGGEQESMCLSVGSREASRGCSSAGRRPASTDWVIRMNPGCQPGNNTFLRKSHGL